MSDPKPRRFPFWLTLSVLGNLVLVGLLAGIFLQGPRNRGDRPDRAPPGFELSAAERGAVRELMRESFEAGRAAMETRREAERALAAVLGAEPYDDAAARAALANLREADRAARDVVANRMLEGIGELTPDQRALVARLMAGNMEKRGQRGERLEKWRERREERRERPPAE